MKTGSRGSVAASALLGGMLVAALAAAPGAAAASATGEGVLAGGPGVYPGGVAGVDYESGGVRGVTDAAGRFHFRGNGTMHFSIGSIELGNVRPEPVVTPFALAGDRECATTEGVARTLVFLQSIDDDANPDNGIQISPQTRERATDRVRVQDLSDAAMTSLVGRLTGRTSLAPRAQVLDRFYDQVDSETWAQQSSRSFGGDTAVLFKVLGDMKNGTTPSTAELDKVPGLLRSQGVATDGHSLFFSWQYGLTRTKTDPEQTVQAYNTPAIPAPIAELGGNHIGDIDYYNGKIYAPIEDGDRTDGTPEYSYPHIAVYDAETLQFTGRYTLLPRDLHVEGVPWVAVDARRGYLYTAEWSNTKVLNVFSLKDFHLVKTVPLSRTLDRIQGAKMYGGMLYAFADKGDAKPLDKINPDTGHVVHVYSVPTPPHSEGEGLAFLPTSDGSLLHTLDVAPDQLSVNLRDHRLTRPSLRAQVCDTKVWRD